MDATQEVSIPGAGTGTAPPIDCAEFSAVLERLLSAWQYPAS